MDLLYLFSNLFSQFVSVDFFQPVLALFVVGLCFCLFFKLLRGNYD